MTGTELVMALAPVGFGIVGLVAWRMGRHYDWQHYKRRCWSRRVDR